MRFPASLDPAAVLEDLFENNGWGNSWRDGIYDYVHYHSRIHEVLGIAGGAGKVQFGGKRGAHCALRPVMWSFCPPAPDINAFALVETSW